VEDNNKRLGWGGKELGGRPFDIVVPVMAGEHRRPELVEPAEARGEAGWAWGDAEVRWGAPGVIPLPPGAPNATLLPGPLISATRLAYHEPSDLCKLELSPTLQRHTFQSTFAAS
jgi:hypothetical protein